MDPLLDRAQAKEIFNFQVNYNKRQIKSTWALAFVIAVVFFLEEVFGGSQNVAVLVRMGANVNQRVLNGEYFRLFASVFLHAGLMHVFFNSYVLFALGGFFNRIFGEARYLSIFFISGLSGSLSSIYFGKSAVSVGASGAIWGLFGASLALAVFKSSYLPEAIRLRLRRVTFINLVINLGISFLPMIDFWAHVGGGIGGFIVTLPIIFHGHLGIKERWATWVFRAIASSMAVLYLASIGYGLWSFEPWVDQLKAKVVKTQLSDVPFSVVAPEKLAHEIDSSNTPMRARHTWGDHQVDSVVIDMNFFHGSIFGQKVDEGWLARQRTTVLSDSKVSGDVKKSIDLRKTPSGDLLYYQQHAKNRDITIHHFVITKNDFIIKIAIIASEGLAQTKVEKLADKLIAGITFKG